MQLDLVDSIFYPDKSMPSKKDTKVENEHDLKSLKEDGINLTKYISYSTTNLSFVVIFLIISLFIGFMVRNINLLCIYIYHR